MWTRWEYRAGVVIRGTGAAERKNSVADFDLGANQEKDDRVDAMAVSPLCLKVAFNIDNKHGYIPLKADYHNYSAERAREEKVGFAPCECLNCCPNDATQIINVFQQINTDNFHTILKDPGGVPCDTSIVTLMRQKTPNKGPTACKLSPIDAAHLPNHLVEDFRLFMPQLLDPDDKFVLANFFGPSDAIQLVIRGPWFPGQIEWLMKAVVDWMAGDYYQNILLQDAIIAAEEIQRAAEVQEQAYKILQKAATQDAKKRFQQEEKKRERQPRNKDQVQKQKSLVALHA
ncbi:hypothetical protein Pst134EB_018065 [Puccinia striiformis f. sp. tritici]|nr:hypothetical protein Pst134EB_018065 [Puccinia striiformis f. sp. tritici]